MSEPHSMPEGRRQRPSAISYAFVAGAALAAGVWVGTMIVQEPTPGTSVSLASTGIIPPSSPLHDTLEQVPSGAEREIETGVIAKPLLSYLAMGDVWCRRFELRAASGRTDAIACRGADMWRIAALTTGPGGDPSEHARSEDKSVIDVAVDATIDGAPLDPPEELEVMVGDWQPDAL